MNVLYLLEPESPGAPWTPFQGVRPLAELRAGIWRVRERWEAAAGTEQISGNIAGVADAARRTSEGIAQSRQATAELASMSGDLNALVSKFRYSK